MNIIINLLLLPLKVIRAVLRWYANIFLDMFKPRCPKCGSRKLKTTTVGSNAGFGAAILLIGIFGLFFKPKKMLNCPECGLSVVV